MQENKIEDAKQIYLKVILLGDGRVGKTSLLNQLTINSFNSSYRPTIGADFRTFSILLTNEKVVIDL